MSLNGIWDMSCYADTVGERLKQAHRQRGRHHVILSEAKHLRAAGAPLRMRLEMPSEETVGELHDENEEANMSC